MGKKKKAKLSKGDISVVSKGFDNTDEYEREELLAYFDQMKASMENGEDVTEIMRDISSMSVSPSVGVKQLESELNAFLYGDSDDEHNDEPLGAEVESFMSIKEEVVSVKPEKMVDENINIELAVVEKHEDFKMVEQQKVDTPASSNIDFVENVDEIDNVFVPDVNYGLIVEDDNELLTVTSRFKSACTIDLYNMRKEGSAAAKSFDDEVKLTIFVNINTLIKGMIYPDFLMKYDDFVNKVIKTGAIIPDDVYVRTAIGPDGTSYVGMFRFDQDDYDESIDDLCDYIDESGINFFQVIIQLISSISSITFKENECDRYFTKSRINLNREITSLFIEYCTNEGTSIIDDDQDDIVDEFFKKLSDERRLITQAIIRDAASTIQNILIGDEDEVHEPVENYEESEGEDVDALESTEEEEPYETESEYNYDTDLIPDGAEILESDAIGSSVFSEAIKKSGFSAVVDEDESEKDASWFLTPHTKPGR